VEFVVDQAAREWLEKHKDLLPKMNDGERLGGDPIVYTGDDTLGFAEFLQALPIKYAQIANQEEHCCSPKRAEDRWLRELQRELMCGFNASSKLDSLPLRLSNFKARFEHRE